MLHVKQIQQNRVYQFTIQSKVRGKLHCLTKWDLAQWTPFHSCPKRRLNTSSIVRCCVCLSRNEGLQPCSTNPQHPRKTGECIYRKYGKNSSQDGTGFQQQGKHQLVSKVTGSRLGLFFDLEDRGNMFLRNFGWLSTDYMALYPRR
jgi:hypothetical protein